MDTRAVRNDEGTLSVQSTTGRLDTRAVRAALLERIARLTQNTQNTQNTQKTIERKFDNAADNSVGQVNNDIAIVWDPKRLGPADLSNKTVTTSLDTIPVPVGAYHSHPFGDALVHDMKRICGKLASLAAVADVRLGSSVSFFGAVTKFPLSLVELRRVLKALYTVCVALTHSIMFQHNGLHSSEAFWLGKSNKNDISAVSSPEKKSRNPGFRWYKELLGLAIIQLKSVDLQAHKTGNGVTTVNLYGMPMSYCRLVPSTGQYGHSSLPVWSYGRNVSATHQDFARWFRKHCLQVAGKDGTHALHPFLCKHGMNAFSAAVDGKPVCSANATKKLLKMLYVLCTLVAATVQAAPERFNASELCVRIKGLPFFASLELLAHSQAMLNAINFVPKKK